jgi:hypothetical protein
MAGIEEKKRVLQSFEGAVLPFKDGELRPQLMKVKSIEHKEILE